MKKYYYDEHETAYQEMKQKGIQAWDEYYDPDTYSYDHFMMRPFLERALGMLNLNSDLDIEQPTAFEYGCGTGAGASFLTQCGFRVEAIDLSPTAISIAQEIAKERHFNIQYRVGDFLALPTLEKTYDLILDNYCLQSIVTDRDREKLFQLVRGGLKESGYYILATAMFHEDRNYSRDDCYYDPSSGIVYVKASSRVLDGDTIYLHGSYWIPHRRHLKEAELHRELTNAGFDVFFQEGGNVICTRGVR